MRNCARGSRNDLDRLGEIGRFNRREACDRQGRRHEGGVLRLDSSRERSADLIYWSSDERRRCLSSRRSPPPSALLFRVRYIYIYIYKHSRYDINPAVVQGPRALEIEHETKRGPNALKTLERAGKKATTGRQGPFAFGLNQRSRNGDLLHRAGSAPRALAFPDGLSAGRRPGRRGDRGFDLASARFDIVEELARALLPGEAHGMLARLLSRNGQGLEARSRADPASSTPAPGATTSIGPGTG